MTAPASVETPPDLTDAVHITLDDHGGPDWALCGEDVRHLPWIPHPRGLCPPCEAVWLLIRAGGAS